MLPDDDEKLAATDGVTNAHAMAPVPAVPSARSLAKRTLKRVNTMIYAGTEVGHLPSVVTQSIRHCTISVS